MLTVEDLTFSYRRKHCVLCDVSFSLKPGITLLVGENGSGKSTLMQILTGALYSKSPILLNDKVMGDNLRKKKMAYLPQEFDFYPSLTVYEVLRFVGSSKGVEKQRLAQEITSAAAQVNIANVMHKKIKQCSVGIRRRVGIAAALLGDPEIVILDEPTAGIDPKERTHFYQIIKKCFSNKIVLLATHILDDMDILADYVLMLTCGRITYDGTYHNFRHSLDNNLYQLETITLSDDEKDFISNGILLSEVHSEDKTIYRVVATKNYTQLTEHCIQVKPTSKDIWLYYQRESNG
jgi:ABC-2 type transport system ATP-binding protein